MRFNYYSHELIILNLSVRDLYVKYALKSIKGQVFD